MRVETQVAGWAVVLVGAVLLTTGCASLETGPGGGGIRGPGALSSTHPTSHALAFAETSGQEQQRLHRRRGERGLGGSFILPGVMWVSPEEASAARRGPPTCGGREVPADWPDFSTGGEELLGPFLTCTSPGEFVELQQRVDMPRLVEALDEWSAVRLGALGPVREDAAHLLQRKRAAFLVSATERYGPMHAEVFALFVLHSAYDDEVEEVLRLLAGDKQLGQTLALMPAVGGELEARGLPLSKYPERGEQAGDVLRGLGRAARDALATSQVVEGPRYMEMTGRWGQMPPPYQRAAREVERALTERHFSAGSVVPGSFDAMTFGVPLGFYYLAAGTGQGAYSLAQGHYEQATRELAPALLLGTLYAGGKGLRALSGVREGGAPALGLRELARQVEARLGVEGLRELAREIRARREVGRLVAVGGVDAALAVREARGDVARAQALMAKARPGATGSAAGSGRNKAAGQVAGAAEHTGSLAALVDEGVGLTREVVEARLALMELEAAGPRLPRDVAVLERLRPSPDAPLPGGEGNPRWREYVAYYETRLKEIYQGQDVKGPLGWKSYEQMRGWFTRGLAFERLMVAVLEADAALPRAQRRFLGAFDKPRIETYVGVRKPESGLRYADVLVIEEGEISGGSPRVETFSFKSRDLSGLELNALKAQMIEDAREALQKYGGTLDIRRESLQSLLLGGSEVPVQRVRLVYEGSDLKPTNMDRLKRAMGDAKSKAPGVEVLFQ